MIKEKISGGVVHNLPDDLRDIIASDVKVMNIWKEITPLARNEWICWITSAKRVETRTKRINVGLSKMRSGMRRPWCWAGCPHRGHYVKRKMKR